MDLLIVKCDVWLGKHTKQHGYIKRNVIIAYTITLNWLQKMAFKVLNHFFKMLQTKLKILLMDKKRSS